MGVRACCSMRPSVWERPVRFERDGRVLPLVVRVDGVLYEVDRIVLVEDATYLPGDAIVSRGPVYLIEVDGDGRRDPGTD